MSSHMANMANLHSLAFWTALVKSGYAFVLSPEFIVLAAGETGTFADGWSCIIQVKAYFCF